MRKPRLRTAGKKTRLPGMIIAVIAIAAVLPALHRQAGRPPAPAPALVAASGVQEAPAEDTAAAATEDVAAALTLQHLGAQCLAALHDRYPRGRLLKVQINQRAEICNAMIETDVGSDRFFGIQWRYASGDFEQLGEVRLPEGFRAAGALPPDLLDWDELRNRDLLALQTELLPEERIATAQPWAIQRVWMPAPFGRPVWMLGYDYEGEFNWYMDVDGDAQAQQVVDSMPALNEDLEDAAASPDVVAERAAGKAAMLALEGGSAAAGSVYASAEWCAAALPVHALSARILRVAITAQSCSLTLEQDAEHGIWRILQLTGPGPAAVGGDIQVPAAYVPPPNYAIDPAWVAVQDLQDRLLRQGIHVPPQSIGMAWDPRSRDTVWVVQPQQLERSDAAPVRFDRDGQPSQARFPRQPGDALGDPDGTPFAQADALP